MEGRQPKADRETLSLSRRERDRKGHLGRCVPIPALAGQGKGMSVDKPVPGGSSCSLSGDHPLRDVCCQPRDTGGTQSGGIWAPASWEAEAMDWGAGFPSGTLRDHHWKCSCRLERPPGQHPHCSSCSSQPTPQPLPSKAAAFPIIQLLFPLSQPSNTRNCVSTGWCASPTRQPQPQPQLSRAF